MRVIARTENALHAACAMEKETTSMTKAGTLPTPGTKAAAEGSRASPAHSTAARAIFPPRVASIPREGASQYRRHARRALGCAIVTGGQGEHRAHKIWVAHNHDSGEQRAGQGGKEQCREHLRLLAPDEAPTLGKIGFHRLKRSTARLSRRRRELYAGFKERRHEKTQRRPGHNRLHAQIRICRCAEKRSQERGERLYLAHERVAAQHVIAGEHLRYAGLYRRRQKPPALRAR